MRDTAYTVFRTQKESLFKFSTVSFMLYLDGWFCVSCVCFLLCVWYQFVLKSSSPTRSVMLSSFHILTDWLTYTAIVPASSLNRLCFSTAMWMYSVLDIWKEFTPVFISSLTSSSLETFLPLTNLPSSMPPRCVLPVLLAIFVNYFIYRPTSGRTGNGRLLKVKVKVNVDLYSALSWSHLQGA